MKQIVFAACLAALVALTACGRSSNVTTQSAVTGAPSAGGTVLVKSGTTFQGALQQEIATNKSHDGDTFTLAQHDTLMHKEPALHGAVIEGHVENVSAAGVGKKPALTVVFDDIRMPDGTTAPVNVRVVNISAFDAKTHHWRTFGMVLGGAIAGHMAAGKHHGGLAGAAGGYVLSQQMKTNVDAQPGTIVVLKFVSDAVAQTSAAPSSSP